MYLGTTPLLSLLVPGLEEEDCPFLEKKRTLAVILGPIQFLTPPP